MTAPTLGLSLATYPFYLVLTPMITVGATEFRPSEDVQLLLEYFN